MLSKAVIKAVFVLCGVIMAGCIYTQREDITKLKQINAELQVNTEELTQSKAQLENEISTLNKTIDNLKGMEFKFIYPTGMDFDITAGVKTGENGYYAEISINSVTANAGMATDFEINGSEYTLSLNDFDLLARTVRAESGGMSEQANIATANVILHRVDSELYPDSIYSVVHQPYQFEVVDRGTYLQQPTDKAIVATAKALNGVDVVPSALGFWNAEVVPAGHELWKYPVLYRIDDHVFSRLDG